MVDDGGEQLSTITFHGWKYRHYFDFVSVKGEKNINVRCKLCSTAGCVELFLRRKFAFELLHENVTLVAVKMPEH